MGRFQPKAHPRWSNSIQDKTWFYILMGLIAIVVLYLMIKY